MFEQAGYEVLQMSTEQTFDEDDYKCVMFCISPVVSDSGVVVNEDLAKEKERVRLIKNDC